jgi:hypothetical protein
VRWAHTTSQVLESDFQHNEGTQFREPHGKLASFLVRSFVVVALGASCGGQSTSNPGSGGGSGGGAAHGSATGGGGAPVLERRPSCEDAEVCCLTTGACYDPEASPKSCEPPDPEPVLRRGSPGLRLRRDDLHQCLLGRRRRRARRPGRRVSVTRPTGHSSEAWSCSRLSDGRSVRLRPSAPREPLAPGRVSSSHVVQTLPWGACARLCAPLRLSPFAQRGGSSHVAAPRGAARATGVSAARGLRPCRQALPDARCPRHGGGAGRDQGWG